MNTPHPLNPDAKILAQAGILHENAGFYVLDAKARNRFEVYTPGATAAHCVGFRAKDEPDALDKCKRTVDRLARYPQALRT